MKNEYEEEYVPRTMSSIIYEKYLDQLERASLDKILDVSGRIAVGVTLSAALVLGNELGAVLAANGYAIPKVAGCLLLGWYKRPIFGAVMAVRAKLSETIDRESRQEIVAPELPEPSHVLSIDGVPVTEIASFVFETRGWAKKEVEALGIGRTASEKIGKGLERVGAFSRGANNARVLVEGYRLEDLGTVLANFATSGEFTATPLPSPASGTGFSITPLSDEL